jgi:hypothetical protein
MSKRICEHIQDDGLRCTNPAMYRREICFHHWRQLRPTAPPSDPAYVPTFDSEASISNASAHMFRSVLAGKVDLKQARLALHFLRETARSLRRQRKIGDKSEIHFTSFMADYYSALDEIQAKSAAAYPDPQPLIYPAHFRDLPEDYDDDAASSESNEALSSRAPASGARDLLLLPASSLLPLPMNRTMWARAPSPARRERSSRFYLPTQPRTTFWTPLAPERHPQFPPRQEQTLPPKSPLNPLPSPPAKLNS